MICSTDSGLRQAGFHQWGLTAYDWIYDGYQMLLECEPERHRLVIRILSRSYVPYHQELDTIIKSTATLAWRTFLDYNVRVRVALAVSGIHAKKACQRRSALHLCDCSPLYQVLYKNSIKLFSDEIVGCTRSEPRVNILEKIYNTVSSLLL